MKEEKMRKHSRSMIYEKKETIYKILSRTIISINFNTFNFAIVKPEHVYRCLSAEAFGILVDKQFIYIMILFTCTSTGE